jgi:D-beta-D-heptose 7-phosphate kinase/D-beta-D-heptose 1-phosphate adenosyltransferase
LPERDRLLMLCGLEAVTRVCLFPQVDATQFLTRARPDIYVKGGDYTLDTLNQTERATLDRMGVTIKILPRFGDQSTTSIMRRINGGRVASNADAAQF